MTESTDKRVLLDLWPPAAPAGSAPSATPSDSGGRPRDPLEQIRAQQILEDEEVAFLLALAET